MPAYAYEIPAKLKTDLSVSHAGWDDDSEDKQQGEATSDLDINSNPRQFFTGGATYEQHYDAQQLNVHRYAAALSIMHKNGIEISQSKFSCFVTSVLRPNRTHTHTHTRTHTMHTGK